MEGSRKVDAIRGKRHQLLGTNGLIEPFFSNLTAMFVPLVGLELPPACGFVPSPRKLSLRTFTYSFASAVVVFTGEMSRSKKSNKHRDITLGEQRAVSSVRTKLQLSAQTTLGRVHARAWRRTRTTTTRGRTRGEGSQRDRGATS